MKHKKDIIGVLIICLLVIGIMYMGLKSSESPPETTPEETEKYIESIEVGVNTGFHITKEEDIKAIIEIFKAHNTYEPLTSKEMLTIGNTYFIFQYSNGDAVSVNMYDYCARVTGKGVYRVGPDLLGKILDYVWTTEEYKEFAEKKGWDVEE